GSLGGPGRGGPASPVPPASSPPAAPSRWPVIDFVDDTMSDPAWSPKQRLIASVSTLSPCGVHVPCALMYDTCAGSTAALFKARPITRSGPSPSSDGAVM